MIENCIYSLYWLCSDFKKAECFLSEGLQVWSCESVKLNVCVYNVATQWETLAIGQLVFAQGLENPRMEQIGLMTYFASFINFKPRVKRRNSNKNTEEGLLRNLCHLCSPTQHSQRKEAVLGTKVTCNRTPKCELSIYFISLQTAALSIVQAAKARSRNCQE